MVPLVLNRSIVDPYRSNLSYVNLQAGEITLAEIRDPALREWVRKKTKEAADHAFAFDPEFLCHVWNW